MAIDLSGLGLDTIEETGGIRIGCMVTISRGLGLTDSIHTRTARRGVRAPYRRGPVPESRDSGWGKYLWKIRIFRMLTMFLAMNGYVEFIKAGSFR